MTQAELIVLALGGRTNIVEIEPCITRLRTQVVDSSLVDDDGLRAAGAHGIVRSGVQIQIVLGPQADIVALQVEDLL